MAAPYLDNIRDKILSSARKLLHNKAFTDVSLAEIAKDAGVSKGSVYYYYKNKDHILYDLADDYLAKLYDDLRVWVEDESKDTSLPRLLQYIIERGNTDTEKGLRLNLTMDAINGDEILREKLMQRYQLFCKELDALISERLCKAGRDACAGNFYGWLMIIIVDGLMIQTLMGNCLLEQKAFTHQLVDLITMRPSCQDTLPEETMVRGR